MNITVTDWIGIVAGWLCCLYSCISIFYIFYEFVGNAQYKYSMVLLQLLNIAYQISNQYYIYFNQNETLNILESCLENLIILGISLLDVKVLEWFNRLNTKISAASVKRFRIFLILLYVILNAGTWALFLDQSELLQTVILD